MSAKMDFTLNINTAEVGELIKLPGVGSAMAERICAERPFADINDLKRVKGVGSAFLSKLAPHILDSFSVIDDENVVEDEKLSGEEDLASSENVNILTTDGEIPSEPGEKSPSFSRGQAVMMALGSSFLAIILALIFTLSILAGLNGGR
ncbi:MAG: helix-hairpin-helix domain-containing protein, partial [Anaerolineae bacterium]|nr:helix-hairpin-helix domain-containing protein [Anaerolineae bacterium]